VDDSGIKRFSKEGGVGVMKVDELNLQISEEEAVRRNHDTLRKLTPLLYNNTNYNTLYICVCVGVVVMVDSYSKILDYIDSLDNSVVRKRTTYEVINHDAYREACPIVCLK
jgi:hypothetical protein